VIGFGARVSAATPVGGGNPHRHRSATRCAAVRESHEAITEHWKKMTDKRCRNARSGIDVASINTMNHSALLSEYDPTRRSAELRSSDAAPLMRQRRRIGSLSRVSATRMGVVATCQKRLLSHVPEPPLPRVNATATA
jgi:hypothetical protein